CLPGSPSFPYTTLFRSELPCPLRQRNCRRPAHSCAGRHVLLGVRGAGNLCTRPNLDMPDGTRLPAHDDEVSKLGGAGNSDLTDRSEEHTSELQSPCNLV